jgi:hypothetical protein
MEVVLKFLTENSANLLMLIAAPGFISLKIWSLIHPSRKIQISESLIEAIMFSSFNYLVTIWWLPSLLPSWIYFVMTAIVLPILWPILLKCVLTRKFFEEKTISLIPKSWDYFFSKRECCFMLVHLNNGRIIGGLYGRDSFASSYPEKEDLYLQEVWKVDKEGKFIKKISGSKGLLVNYEAIEYIELFNTGGEGNE